jgi:uncharacterized protein YndB with AHSA1/START domain
MTIAPVRTSVEVSQPPAVAFALFTARMGDWWGGKTIGDKPAVCVTVEPFAGGGWFETDEDGRRTLWGRVLVWQPPHRLLLAWELNSRFRPDPSLQTEVEISFDALDAGGTRILLEHRHLERFGADAEAVANGIGQGWPEKLGGFATFALGLSQGGQA